MIKQLWNDDWKFFSNKNTFSLFQSVPSDAETVDLPHDPMFLKPQDEDCESEGRQGFLSGGNWRYFKEYFAPEEDRDKTTKLFFEAASQITAVYVNDSCVAKNVYSFNPFYADLTPYLYYGSPNRILVTTTALERSSRFYAGAGLFRNVGIVKEPKIGFVPEKLQVTTKEINFLPGKDDLADAVLSVRVSLQNKTNHYFKGFYHIAVADRAGKELWNGEYRVYLPAESTEVFDKPVFLGGIIPWDEFHPELYKVSVSIADKEGVLDCDETTTGFRTIELDGKHGLRVNGKEVKLLGGCVHADQGLLGGSTYVSYEYRRMMSHKKLGFNAVRCAHNPASVELLRACDEVGIYVLDETVDIWEKVKNPQDYGIFFEKDIDHVVETMVQTDYNHPSVLLYSTGNEILEIGTEKGFELTNHFTQLLHSLDSTRFVTNAVNAFMELGPILAENERRHRTGLIDPDSDIDVNQFIGDEHGADRGKLILVPAMDEMLEILDAGMDIIGYNYMISRYASDAEKYPNRIILGTETHSKRIPEHYAAMMKYPNVIGDFIWCSYTYLGECGPKRAFPHIMNGSSDISIIGDPRTSWYYRAVTTGLRKEPYIAARTPEASKEPLVTHAWVMTDAVGSWDYPGCEGMEVDVEVYAAGDSVELFLNGVSCGNGTPDPDQVCRYFFRVPYQPGELKAVSKKAGEPDQVYVLKTKGAGDCVDISVDPNPFSEEDGLLFVDVTLKNEAGEPVWQAVPDLTIAVEGSYKLLAFGGHHTLHNGGYTCPTIDVHDGRALAILKKCGEGACTVKISGTGVKEASLEIA